MKLKTLLLGSAAAMIAVSGARAADAVVAEPENVEYVRVCDVYGAGFFYIPGTETCLNFNGYVRSEYVIDDPDDGEGDNQWVYRVRLNIDARNETDYGTLRSQIRFQADGTGRSVNDVQTIDADGNLIGSGRFGNGDAGVGIDRALISLAGIRLGYSDTYRTTNHDYGYWGKYDGLYSYDQAIFLDYTYATNGFAFTVGVQDSTAEERDTESPDPYVGMRYTASWGNVAASIIYDNDIDEAAYKISAGVTPIDGLKLVGWVEFGDNATPSGNFGTAAALLPFVLAGDNQYIDGLHSDYAWGVGARYEVTSDLAVFAGYTATDGQKTIGAGTVPGTFRVVDGDDASFAQVGLTWKPVPGLEIQPEAEFDLENDNNRYVLRVVRSF